LIRLHLLKKLLKFDNNRFFGTFQSAEIMDEIQRLSTDYWRPSPGSIYPILEELADKGKEELVWPSCVPTQGSSSSEAIVNEMTGFVSYFEDLAKLSVQFFLLKAAACCLPPSSMNFF
jgi:hypothetical protein